MLFRSFPGPVASQQADNLARLDQPVQAIEHRAMALEVQMQPHRANRRLSEGFGRGGVGGIEQSLTDAGLLVGLAWSLLGCAIMWWGVRAMPQSSLR